MLRWEKQIAESGDLWAVALAEIGGYGYLAVTALTCLIFEWVFRHLGEHWTCLTAGLTQWSDGAP